MIFSALGFVSSCDVSRAQMVTLCEGLPGRDSHPQPAVESVPLALKAEAAAHGSQKHCVHSVTSSPSQQKYPDLATWAFPIVGGLGTLRDLI